MKDLHIVQLYINEMNTYGDRGNLLILSKRMRLHGYNPIIHYHHVGAHLPAKIDIILGGGGQDAAQIEIEQDMQRLQKQLHSLSDHSIPMLMVCGTYQLFGTRFTTSSGNIMKGIGIFDAETIGTGNRHIGNIAIKTTDYGILYGFENHSGRTILGTHQAPLGIVARGNGNNGQDKTEGARTNNVFGTYMHGPVLSYNPIFCDNLIKLAAENAYGVFIPREIDDSLSVLSRQAAKVRAY